MMIILRMENRSRMSGVAIPHQSIRSGTGILLGLRSRGLSAEEHRGVCLIARSKCLEEEAESINVSHSRLEQTERR